MGYIILHGLSFLHRSRNPNSSFLSAYWESLVKALWQNCMIPSELKELTTRMLEWILSLGEAILCSWVTSAAASISHKISQVFDFKNK